jgi:hypothetical protein
MLALGAVLLAAGLALLLCSVIFALVALLRRRRTSLVSPLPNEKILGSYNQERVAYFIDLLREERGTQG